MEVDMDTITGRSKNCLSGLYFWAFLIFAGTINFKATAQTEKSLVEVVKWSQVESVLKNSSPDTVYVVNFWATWCKPCVKELPAFDSLTSVYAGRPLKVLLISLDFKRQLQDRLIPFLDKSAIKSAVWLLDEPDQNSWIDKVSPDWSGSIPATVIICKSEKFHKFYEREFTFIELQKIINPLLN
jgi:thiol-disulfide isomerase/thioredoxin